MRSRTSLFVGLLSLAASVSADPTWPASTDDLEEIMYQLQGFGARSFSEKISPCSNEASGPGRQNAAEWLRIGFHDMSTANTYFGTGGLDGSLQFELKNTENTGPGHATTLAFLGKYLSARSSIADLIAAGTYASVRSCGGPVVPVRGGRVDATESGDTGVPQPQNAISIFINQFDRMGFTVPEMIQLTACGHTLGGVHSEDFPELVPAGSAPNGEAGLDSTVADFDNKVVTEYLAGVTTNPLVVGPSVAQSKNSDFKVFNADKNVTMNALSSATVFQSTCKTVLQKMIDTVPTGVVLTDPVTPYAVKPVNMQLTLNADGTAMLLSGYIRVRTTDLPATSISGVTLTYKDREGGNDCGSCATTATTYETGAGFDDTFAFFPISADVDTATGISSFTVTITLDDATTQEFDNNGASYPISDAVLLQEPQSCLTQTSGALTVSALVRNDRTSLPVTLEVSYLVPRNTPDGNPVPALMKETIAMTEGDCVGDYTFYSGSYTITGGLSSSARVDVISGEGEDAISDAFNSAGDLPGTCAEYTGSAACGGSPTGTASPTESPTATETATETTTDTDPTETATETTTDTDPTETATETTTDTDPTETATETTTDTDPTATESPTPTATLGHREVVGGYELVSCWNEVPNGRALTGAAFAYDGMTLETCMGNCSSFVYWATEYGKECYCGNTLDSTVTEAPLSECDMVCDGDATEYCGAGNRLELYSTTATQTTTPTPTPTATLAVKPTVAEFTFVGCITEAIGVRALSSDTYSDDDMTLESCAAFCTGYNYFGTEYGRECYCGNSIHASSTDAPLADCSMTCSGDPYEYCGNGNRLELYSIGDIPTTPPSTTTAEPTTTATPEPTPTQKPTVDDYTLVGCWTEGTGVRALTGPSYSSGTEMTLESCAAFCAGNKYFGTEYGGECYCGNLLAASSAEADQADCSMPCTGDATELCGAGNRLSLYSTDDVTAPPPTSQPETVVGDDDDATVWTFEDCYTENAAVEVGVRTLGAEGFADDGMTLEVCAGLCADYAYFGTEYGRECYCGDTLAAGSEVALGSNCDMPCAGNVSEYCGAGNRLSVYAKVE